MRNKFTTDTNTKIILYGAASIGLIMYGNLKKQGYHILCFIDKRAEEIKEIEGVPVYLPEDAYIQGCDKTNTVIIVSVKNVFEHDKIAHSLRKLEFKNLIYKSGVILNGEENPDLLQLSKAYDAILQEQEIPPVLPVSEEIVLYTFRDYSTIVVLDDESRITYVPVELIFTNQNKLGFSRWNDIPILLLYPHLQFFLSLNGEMEYTLDSYLKFCEEAALRQGNIEITESWKQNILRNRTMVFEQMKLSHDINSNFFIDSPAEAEWNFKGYFNLTGGKHRVTFLVAQGHNYIPLKISNQDFDRWLKALDSGAVCNYIQDNCLRSLPNAISHPYFFRLIETKDLFKRDILLNTFMYISRIYTEPEKWKKLDIGVLGTVDSIALDLLCKTGSTVSSCNLQEIENRTLFHLQPVFKYDYRPVSQIKDILIINKTELSESIFNGANAKIILTFLENPKDIQLKGYKKAAKIAQVYQNNRIYYLCAFEKFEG